jgi:CRP/FNR family transcriptional regulator, cyclic AMP receptor protein
LSSGKTSSLQFLTANDWALLRDKARHITLQKDQPLIVEGTLCKSLFLLISGSVRVERKTIDGGVAKLALLGPGDVCGEMAFIEKTRSSASVIADDEVTAEAFDAAVLVEAFDAFPHLGARFFRSLCLVLSQRLRNTSAALAAARAAKTAS